MAQVRFNESTYTRYDQGVTPISRATRQFGVEKAKLYDAGFSFLTSQLAVVDPHVYAPKANITYKDDIAIEQLKGFLDYVEYYTSDWGGVADDLNNVFANNANYIPRVNAGLYQNRLKIFTLEIAYDLRWIELEKLAKQKLPTTIEALYKDTIAIAWDLMVNRAVYTGIGGAGGLLTSSKVPVYTLPITNALLSVVDPQDGDYVTNEALLAILNGMAAIFMQADGYVLDFLPDTMLIPGKFREVLSSRTSALLAQNLQNYFAKNNAFIDEAQGNGLPDHKFKIVRRVWCDGVGEGGADRIVLYKNSPEFVKIWLKDIAQYWSGPNPERLGTTTLFVGQVSEIQMPYSLSADTYGPVVYFDIPQS